MDELAFYNDLTEFKNYALKLVSKHLNGKNVNMSINISPRMSMVSIDIISKSNLDNLFK